jgi:hypothetical protein
MSQVQLEAFFHVQNACTAFPSTLVSMLELSPPILLFRVAGLSGLNTIIVLTQDNINTEKLRNTPMPRVEFKPTIPVFELQKTGGALDHVSTVTGCCRNAGLIIPLLLNLL